MNASLTRRAFVGTAAAVAAAPARLRGEASITPPPPSLSPVVVAPDDEAFWGGVQARFELDRSATYLNAAGFAPASAGTLDAMLQDTAFRNRLPARHLWTVLQPRVEGVREQLARAFGCDPEELALTRNATEAMQIVQLGLDLHRGDEVLTTKHDFFRMLNTWEQRVARDGVVLTTVDVPTPPAHPEDLVDIFARALTPRTRVLMVCQVTNVNGQIFPIRDICRMARARGVITIVDGAQAYGHIPVDTTAPDWDYYCGSLHKYVMAPLGTGFLHMRRALIPGLWPLTPASPSRRDNIRKFEDIGTHPAAAHNAIGEAIRHRASLGQDNITARLAYLTQHWVTGLRAVPRIELFNTFAPEHTCGMATVGMAGMEPRTLVNALWDRFRIVTRPVARPECSGVRVSPHVYNKIDEMQYFVDAMSTLTRE